MLMNPLLVEEVFCHDCPEADKARLKRNGKWQSLACLTTPISVTESRYGRIPKYYIRCTQSRDLDRSLIVDNVACEKVYTLPSSHSPFFSMPDKLVGVLGEIYQLPVVNPAK